MVKKSLFFFCFAANQLFSVPVSAQDRTLHFKWTASSPFEHKEFVLNNGQFDGKNDPGASSLSNIQYGCRTGDLQMYFTATGLCYRYDEAVYEEENDVEGKEKEEDKKNSIKVPHLMSMEWVNADPSARIEAADQASWYFTYGDMRDKSGKTGIKALAFKKITYRNIYPNIDVEYIFPEDTGGVKYSIILHPGADLSDIKMKYSGVKRITSDRSGNLILHSNFGNFTDHAPVTFYDGDMNSRIQSSFSVKGNIVSFNVADYDKNKTVVIDPWTVNPPGFTSSRKAAYDVEFDLQGNVYAYGGYAPFEVIKYNSAGVQQWIHQTVFVTDFYGDFCVDGFSGSAYMVEGYRQGAAQVIKINSAGIQQGIYAGTPNMDEMSRVVFNNCTKKAVIAGGGVSGNCQAGVLDTTLATFTPVNVLGSGTPLHDFALLALDNANQCYMATTKSFMHPALFDNRLVKCPANTLSPNAYMVPTNYQFLETASIKYTNTPWQAQSINGFNGIAVSAKYVYTYDGQVLKRWNKLNGAFINSATVTATPFICGGITTDDCDNIFVGVEKSVVRYDTNFTVLSTTVFPDTVYDVRLSPANEVYACGKNFVASYLIAGGLPTCNSLSVTLTPQGSCGSGTVVANVTGGTPVYSYAWLPGGQTTSTVSGLSPGTYTVIVGDNTCQPKAVTGTITVGASSFSVTSTSTPATCANNNGTASVTVVTGTSPYTYVWSPTGGSTSAATGLSAGSYSVLVTDASGCTSINTVSVTIPNAPALNLTQTNILCNGGGNGSASVAVTGGSSPYTYAWSPSGGSSSAASGLAAGSYSAVVTDANGCSQTQTFTITQPVALSAAATASVTSCGANNGSASVNASGGTGTFTYSWSPSGGNNSVAAGLGVGSYTVTVTDANGCSTNASAAVTALGGPVLTLANQTSVACNGGSNASASVSVSGGSGPYTYLWSPSGGASSAATGLSAGNYSCTVTDATGCTNVVMVNITQPAGISASATATATPCGTSNGSSSVSASGGTGALSYSWSPSGGNNATAVGLAGGTYTVIVTDGNGCTYVATATVNVLNGPTANAGANANIIIGDSTSLSGAGGVTYVWTPSSSLSCTSCQNPVAFPTVTTTYTLIVTDANGCTGVDVVTVTVEPISCNNKPNAGNFYLPNAFSPNADGENDELCLLGWDECLKGFSIKIFNRWGQLVFESDDKSFCWDGSFNGKPLDTGTFPYFVKAVLYNGVKRDEKGNISLIR